MKDLNFTPVSVHDAHAQTPGEAFSAEPETGLGADQHQNAQGDTTCREAARLGTWHTHAEGYRHRPAQLPEQ